MALGSVSTVTSSSTATSVSSGFPNSDKPGPNHSRFLTMGRRNPPMLRMVLEALQAGERRQGTSVVAIKVYILHKYPTVDVTRFKYLLKQALDTGMRRGLLTRPANSKAKGATGSFKLVPKHKKKISARRTGTLTAPRRAMEAKQAGSKKPGEPKQDSANMAKMEKATTKPKVANKAHPCLGTTQEKAPKRANQARDAGAKLGKAKKVPLKSAKAMRFPSSANGFSRKSEVKGSSSRQGVAEAHRKTKADRERSKPSASKVNNGVASPTKRKMAAKASNKTTFQGAKVEPKTKAAPQAGRPKAQPTHRARKSEAPNSPRRPRLPAKASSSQALSKKAEPES